VASQNAPMEAKVVAAGWTALVASFIVSWIVTAVPGLSSMGSLLQSLIVAALTSAAAFIAGWLARHTPRPGDNPPAPPSGM
jgi:hypothetical protein